MISYIFQVFIGLFALVNPVGIIPVFISMTSYQTAAARNKTNLTANLSVAIILLTSLYLGDAILQVFGISIDSFRIAGGILVVTIAMSMISGKLGEDKQNKQEKSETAIRESIGVVPLALPLMAARGDQFHYCLGNALPQPDAPDWLFRRYCAVRAVLGCISYGAMAGSLAGTNGHQRDYPYHGSVVNGVGHRIYRYRY